MANVAYSTSAQNFQASGTSLVITNPGCAAGNLLIADITSGGTINTPTGWTALTVTGRQIFVKIADSADAAAANFTFSQSATTAIRGGLIVATLADTINVATDILVHGTSDSSGSIPTEPGITAPYAGFYMILVAHADGVSGRTVSTYAMANNNPAWTEIYDVTTANSLGVSAAYASKTVAGATGNVTAVASGGLNSAGIAILYVPSQTNVTPTAAALVGTLKAPTIGILVSAAASLVSSIVVPTFTEVASKWKSTAKNAASWINPSKS